MHSASKLKEDYFPKILVIFKWLYLCEKWTKKIFKKRILTLEVSNFRMKDSIFLSIMILFYQDEAQVAKFQNIWLSLNVCTGQQNFFPVKPM